MAPLIGEKEQRQECGGTAHPTAHACPAAMSGNTHGHCLQCPITVSPQMLKSLLYGLICSRSGGSDWKEVAWRGRKHQEQEESTSPSGALRPHCAHTHVRGSIVRPSESAEEVEQAKGPSVGGCHPTREVLGSEPGTQV